MTFLTGIAQQYAILADLWKFDAFLIDKEKGIVALSFYGYCEMQRAVR